MAQDDIQGQVVDAQGNPVDGAIVELTKSYQSSPLDEQVVRRTTTDANGNYIFEFHPDGDGTTQEWHVSCYNHDGTAYVNSFNNPGVTADLPSNAIPDSVVHQYPVSTFTTSTWSDAVGSADMTVNGLT
ncbi:MAG TPA: carboxypeptidase-like regulatory domain-containing protein, partial [Candidatus Paceibacterota bacterium]|nr:carboxypeptidase-like regulatory domain-containing protein [Candidatus Paceibacterota bacterium]